MHVVYDLLGFQSRDHGERGIARYVLHLALALERVRPGLVAQYLMHPHLPFPAGAEPLVATGRVVRSDRLRDSRAPSAGGVFIAGSPFEDYSLPSELVFPSWARSPSWRIAAVLHDLIPLKFPELYWGDDLNRHHYQARLSAVGSVDRMLANSEATAGDVVEMIGYDPGRVTVIGAGADGRFRHPSVLPGQVAAELARDGQVPGLRPGYVFFPTGLDPRKNYERTIEAYGLLPAELRRRHPMVLTCQLGEHGRYHVECLAAEAGVSNDLLITGYVDDDLLCRLYQGAELVVFPSLYEGFGLPVLEAMQCGAPVIVADSSSLQEVQTITEARFDPLSVTSISAALSRALGDEGLRARLRDQPLPPFTWDLAAERAAEVIDGVADELRERATLGGTALSGAARPRLALVGPLAPEPCATASYTYRLADGLQHHADVTVFAGDDRDDPLDPELVDAPVGVTVEPLRRLDLITRSGGAFDRVLYLIAGNACHVGALRALRQLPGDVLLCDLQLSELYRHLHRVAPDELVDGSVGATVEALYPRRYRPAVTALSAVPREIADRFGVLLLREVAQLAERLFVGSSYDASLLELDTGAEPVAAIGMPCPPVVTAPAAPDQVGTARRPLISVLGAEPSLVEIELLLQALAVVRQGAPGTRLRLAVELSGRQRAGFTELTRAAGVVGAAYLDHPGPGAAAVGSPTTIAVVLSRPGGAESQMAVAELLAVGVPTIVADLGPMTGLPDDVVVKVDPAVSPGRLGEVITDLLADGYGRDTLSQAARDYAKATGFAHAAEVLVDVLFGPGRADSWPPPLPANSNGTAG